MARTFAAGSSEAAPEAAKGGGFERGVRSVARFALLLAIVCAALELLAGPGYRFGVWGLGVGLQTMRWAATVAAGTALVALVCAVVAAWRHVPRALGAALAGLAVGLAASLPPAWFWYQVSHLPHIHDVSTDTEHPPGFVAVVRLRSGARNPIDYTDATAILQRRGYPDIGPLVLDMSPAQALQRAERAARAMGWDVVEVAPRELRIEAVATSMLFGFKDDVVIRVMAQGASSRVDVRSLSRVGGSDFGANAKRIRAFLARLKAEASSP